MQLVTRHRDAGGGAPVLITNAGDKRIYELKLPDAPDISMLFPTAKKLLIHLTGHPQGRNWTFDRYFQLGKYSPSGISVPDSILDLLSSNVPLIVTPSANALQPNVHSSPVISTTAVGIDLVRRSGEVSKLFYAGFGWKLANAGYDPQEVLQEVYSGILTRNKGSCPWDPKKSSFGHYVHMICGCVVSNYIRKHSKFKTNERVGILGFTSDGELEVTDAGSSAVVTDNQTFNEGAFMNDIRAFVACHQGKSPEGRLALKILPLVRKGLNRAEIADMMSVSKATVSKALAVLRSMSPKWASA